MVLTLCSGLKSFQEQTTEQRLEFLLLPGVPTRHQDTERPMLCNYCELAIDKTSRKLCNIPMLGEHFGILQYDTTIDGSHTLLWTNVLNYSPCFQT